MWGSWPNNKKDVGFNDSQVLGKTLLANKMDILSQRDFGGRPGHQTLAVILSRGSGLVQTESRQLHV